MGIELRDLQAAQWAGGGPKPRSAGSFQIQIETGIILGTLITRVFKPESARSAGNFGERSLIHFETIPFRTACIKVVNRFRLQPQRRGFEVRMFQDALVDVS